MEIQTAAIAAAEILVNPTAGILTDVQYGGETELTHSSMIAGVDI